MGTGLFAPKTIHSQERKFQVCNYRSVELSHPGTFAPGTFQANTGWSESTQPGAKYT